MPLAFIQCLRPKQWTKNLLIFAGLVFTQRWGEGAAVVNAALAFAIFCALSGVVYIVNDILDAEQDRLHPKKCKRPIAAGRISPAAAGTGAALLAAGALALAFLRLPAGFALLAVLYVLLVSAYSFKFKHAVVLDILLLAVGFVIRALAGLEALKTDAAHPVEITSYFLLTTLFLALFLATAKRRTELVSLGGDAGHHRKVLQEYSREFLDILLTVAMAGTLFSYALWTTQGKFSRAAEGAAAGSPYLMVLTMPFVVYGMFRYLWLVVKRGEGGAPETVLLEDKPLLMTVALWTATVVAVLVRLQ